jgi:hypothetical protein
VTTWTGTAPTFVAGDTTTVTTNLNTLRDFAKAASEAWTTYGSGASWTASTSNPAIGNGTWNGRYAQANKLVDFTVKITMGTTTTYGTGTYRVALPVSMSTSSPGRFLVVVTDSSGGTTFHGITYNVSGTLAPIAIDNGTAGGAVAAISPTVPFTFANLDTIEVVGRYEAA